MSAYRMGYRAFYSGADIADNPHPNDDDHCDDCADWERGWWDAEAAYNEQGEVECEDEQVYRARMNRL